MKNNTNNHTGNLRLMTICSVISQNYASANKPIPEVIAVAVIKIQVLGSPPTLNLSLTLTLHEFIFFNSPLSTSLPYLCPFGCLHFSAPDALSQPSPSFCSAWPIMRQLLATGGFSPPGHAWQFS